MYFGILDVSKALYGRCRQCAHTETLCVQVVEISFNNVAILPLHAHTITVEIKNYIWNKSLPADNPQSAIGYLLLLCSDFFTDSLQTEFVSLTRFIELF